MSSEDDARGRPSGLAPAVLLVLSAGLVAVAPVFVSDGYSWIEHSTSESGGQLVEGSWVARTGFMCLGFAVLWLAHLRATVRCWGSIGTLAHRVFGVSMIATAAFATRPWLASAPYDSTEDFLHSVASFGVGAGFLIGVLLVGMHRGQVAGHARWYDIAAFVLVVGVLLAMTVFPDTEGLLQRSMFAVAYLWYGTESLAPAVEEEPAVHTPDPSS